MATLAQSLALAGDEVPEGAGSSPSCVVGDDRVRGSLQLREAAVHEPFLERGNHGDVDDGAPPLRARSARG